MDAWLWFLFAFGIAALPAVAYCVWRDRGRDTTAGALTLEIPPSEVARGTLHHVVPLRHPRRRGG